jgi:hypothetical protein
MMQRHAHRFSNKLGKRAVLMLLDAKNLIEHLGADSQG